MCFYLINFKREILQCFVRFFRDLCTDCVTVSLLYRHHTVTVPRGSRYFYTTHSPTHDKKLLIFFKLEQVRLFFLEFFRGSTKATPRSQMDPRIQGWEPLL